MTVELTNGTILNLGNIKGADGIGISKSEINANGELVLTYTDGNTTNLGVVVGANGTDGVGIKTVTLSTDGELSILLTDNSTYNLGNIKGEKGDKGDQGEKGETGANGKDGRGIESMAFDTNGQLIVTYTDGTTQNLGSISGATADEILIYTLQADGTYSVKAGKDIAYYSDIVIPATYNGRNVTVIEDNGFEGIETIGTVILPNTVVTIGDSAFEGCINLISCSFSNNVTSIGTSTFKNCSNLTTCSSSSSLSVIGAMAFYNCGNLTSFSLPETITEIPDSCFSGCANLNLTIINPDTLTSIGASAMIKVKTIEWNSTKTSTWTLSCVWNGGKLYSGDSTDSSWGYYNGAYNLWNNKTIGSTTAQNYLNGTTVGSWEEISTGSRILYAQKLTYATCTWTRVS